MEVLRNIAIAEVNNAIAHAGPVLIEPTDVHVDFAHHTVGEEDLEGGGAGGVGAGGVGAGGSGAGDEDEKPLIPNRPDFILTPHQVTGVHWMLRRERNDDGYCHGGILGDDMGLGKTCQSISLILNGEPLMTLIVCPPALIYAWIKELQACRLLVSELGSGYFWTGGGLTPEEADGCPELASKCVWITTYQKLTMYERFLCSVPFGRIILDEGHNIRNANTARAISANTVAASAKCRWILSATPIQNSEKDWKNLCNWLRVTSTVSISTLGNKIMLRRTMAEMRALAGSSALFPPPPIIEDHNLHISSDSKEGKLFRTLTHRALNALESDHVNGQRKLELYMRIQQFLVHPQVYIDAMRRKLRAGYRRKDWPLNATQTKWDACTNQIQSAITERVGVIVFCQFHSEMDMLEAHVHALLAQQKSDGFVASIRGGMGSTKIGQAVDRAKMMVEAGKPVIIIVQIVAGGVGLNLQFCRRILFLSQHWNPAVVHQAIGRAVRIGQKYPVQIHFFRVIDSVFENIDRIMAGKHMDKIINAKMVCGSLYDGFLPIEDEAFDEMDMADLVAAQEVVEETDELGGEEPAGVAVVALGPDIGVCTTDLPVDCDPS